MASLFCASGFEPSLWRPNQITDVRPEDRTFAGKLRNLCQAAGIVGQ